jgi:hypothetical protein
MFLSHVEHDHDHCDYYYYYYYHHHHHHHHCLITLSNPNAVDFIFYIWTSFCAFINYVFCIPYIFMYVGTIFVVGNFIALITYHWLYCYYNELK